MGKKKKKNKVDRKASVYWQMYHGFGKVFCPAVRKDVAFTRLGWDHLLTVKKRTRVDRLSRLEYLSYVRSIVETATEVDSQTTDHSYQYVRLIKEVDGNKLAVILTRKKGKEASYSFFSVYKM